MAVANAPAQSLDLVFGYGSAIGGTSADFVSAVATDSMNNVYVMGRFQGTIDIDPGAGVTNITSSGGYDLYICKIDPAGDLLWARVVGDAAVSEESFGMVVDSAGSVYVVGGFSGTLDVDPGVGVFNLTSGSSLNTFILKLDTAGAFQWAGAVGGAATLFSNGIGVDSAFNVYLGGSFRNTADFDPGAGTFNLTSAGSDDAYVCKLDASGAFQWAVSFGSTSIDRVSRLSVDGAGAVLLAGSFNGTVDFDPGAGATNLTSNGGTDAFLSKLDTNGGFLWAQALGGNTTDEALGIAVDSVGNVYATGRFVGNIDLDPGPGTSLAVWGGGADIFILKLAGDGTFQWAAGIGGTTDEFGTSLTVDPSGNVYATGVFLSPTVDFDPGAGVYNLNSFARDAYVVALDSDGLFRWAGSCFGGLDQSGIAAAVDTLGNVYNVGLIVGSADFDPGPGVVTLTSAGANDFYLWKLEPQAAPVAVADAGETDADAILTALLSPVATSVLANDTDPNTVANLTVTAYDAASTLGAVVVVNPDGTFSYDPTMVAALQALSIGDSMIDTFTYTVSDGTDTAVGTVTIVVHGKGSGAGLPALSVVGLVALLAAIALLGARYNRLRFNTRRPSRTQQ